MRPFFGRSAGLTLIEVLMAMVIVALALLAWTRLEARVAQLERSNQVRRELAAWMRSELRIQRNVRAFTCRSRTAPSGWTCTLTRVCLDVTPGPAAPCESESIRVTITSPVGPALTGATAVWWPLQRALVEPSP